jgi:deoxyribose-phosphate aldolase
VVKKALEEQRRWESGRYPNSERKIKLCQICGKLGADWVKTSTGYGNGGATVEYIMLMRQHLPTAVQIKAAGRIRTLDWLLEMRAAGVSRVGASRTFQILDSLL